MRPMWLYHNHGCRRHLTGKGLAKPAKSQRLVGQTSSPKNVHTFSSGPMGPVQIRHCSHDFGWQSRHDRSVDLAGWQAKMASIEIWIP